MLYVDWVSNNNGSEARLLLISPEGWDIQYALHFGFPSTNNEAKYKTLITLTITKEMGVKHLKAHSNSWLVVSHISNEYEAQEQDMKQYLQKVRKITQTFYNFNIQQILRKENARANILSKLATSVPNSLCV